MGGVGAHTEQGWISPALAVVVPGMVSRSQPSTPSKGYKNEVLEKKALAGWAVSNPSNQVQLSISSTPDVLLTVD